MENDILEKLKENGEQLQKIFVSVEKTRRYFLWTLISTLLVVLLPAVGLLFAIPKFLDTYGQIGL